MRLTESEKRLLRQQAEAYAFIYDVRKFAIERGDGVYIRMTAGIEDKIKLRREEYPGTFQRYFKEALFKGMKAKQEQDGKREDAKRRQEETAQKELLRKESELLRKRKKRKPRSYRKSKKE